MRFDTRCLLDFLRHGCLYGIVLTYVCYAFELRDGKGTLPRHSLQDEVRPPGCWGLLTVLCPWDCRQICPLVDVYGESEINGESSEHILQAISPSLPNPITTVVLLRSQWWDAGGTENQLQIVSVSIRVTFTHFSIAVSKENWSFLSLILVMWTQTAGEGTGLPALICVVSNSQLQLGC